MPNPPMVSDTSPLLYLGRIGQLELLPQLFSEVCVPEQVALELDAGRLIRGDTPDPRQIPWIKLVSVTTDMITTLPANNLGLGERATIAYALRKGNFVAALDDKRARLLAQQLKTQVIGVAGILIRAKKAGLFPFIKPYLDAARTQGFYLHADTHAQVLSLAGEAEDKQDET